MPHRRASSSSRRASRGSHGWGVCGKNIARHLSRLEPLRLIGDPLDARAVPDPVERDELNGLLIPGGEAALLEGGRAAAVDGPLLQGVGDQRLMPRRPLLRGSSTVGYTFFERNVLHPAWVENGRRFFDRIVTGSTWCASVLAEHGLAGGIPVCQGIDPNIFFPSPAEDGRGPLLADRFVVFSGGKFEFRKGQDVVIRAYKVLQDRHVDVALVNAWVNLWPPLMDTMRASRLIRYTSPGEAYVQGMNGILADNGIDLERVITCPRQPNAAMAGIYRNTDVGLFPNRCEGGTNLVLMEYMACGKPVIAVDATGHADIVNRSNALVMATKGETTVRDEDQAPIARWPEPDLDDAIDKLEWAYQNRGKMRELGLQAGKDLAKFTWSRTAESLRDIIHQTTTRSP